MRVLMPLPSTDFDPTESGVPWRVLTAAGHAVVFATPDGKRAAADPRMCDGRGLGPWKPLLAADARGRAAWQEMASSPAFAAPIRWADAGSDAFDALVLPGGHAPGMRPYLESEHLQDLAAAMLRSGKPVAAVCHGVLVLARAERRHRGMVLRNRRVTALTAAQELSALALTVWWLGGYYRTYPVSVQTEVTRVLADPRQFETGPFAIRRDSPDQLDRGFVVRDGNLLTARWPGDIHLFSDRLCAMLAEQAGTTREEPRP